MRIEFLYFDGCPNAEEAVARLQETAARICPGTPVEKVKVDSKAAAEERGFYGSPSIRIDGVDLEYDPARKPSMSCRLYSDEGAPPVWLIEAGILRALEPKGLLFLCVANSARSQIAEGLARELAPAGVRVQSAGSSPTGVRPEALEVLSEIGIDASEQRSKAVTDIDPDTVDTVITLCGEEECPIFLGDAVRVHWGLPDPAAVKEDGEARLEAFREVRNELHRRLSVVFPAPSSDEAGSVRKRVSSFYARSIGDGGGCCSGTGLPRGVLAEMAGYSADDLADLPEGVSADSFGCGNPLAFSEVNEGETVLDLGSGAGLDLIIAAGKVGPRGRVIGVDMTEEMIERARGNMEGSGLGNIELREGTIEDLPVESGSVDWVISNCVINLSPEKEKVFAEIFRVLKPGGRVSISDIVAGEIPGFVRESAELHCSCISGAISEEEYLEGLRRSGLADVKVTSRLVYDEGQLRTLIGSGESGGCCGSGESLPAGLAEKAVAALGGKVASVRFSGVKPSNSDRP